MPPREAVKKIFEVLFGLGLWVLVSGVFTVTLWFRSLGASLKGVHGHSLVWVFMDIGYGGGLIL